MMIAAALCVGACSASSAPGETIAEDPEPSPADSGADVTVPALNQPPPAAPTDGGPDTGDYVPAQLSADCTAAIEPLRAFIADNPNPFDLTPEQISDFDRLRFDAVSQGSGPETCDPDEWSSYNESELSPWASGRLIDGTR